MSIHLCITTVVFFSLLVLQSSSLRAQIYICEDSRGGLQYTNVRGSDNCTLLQGRKLRLSNISSQGYGTTGRYTSGGWSRSDIYDDHIQRISAHYNVDPRLVKAVIRTESDFNCYAISKKGAQGLMQLMPATAKILNVNNPFDPQANIDGGTRYLKQLIETFNGNLPLALAAYNAGPTLVKSKNRIPEIPETINYVRRVLGFYKHYKNEYAANVPASSIINIRKLVKN